MVSEAGKISVSEAARVWKKDRTTIYRIINKHNISKEKSEDGKTLIQFVDLRQHLGEPEGRDVTSATTRQQVATPQHDTSDVTGILQQQISDLKEQMKAQREEYRQREESAQKREGELLSIVKQQGLLLEDRREREKPEEQGRKSSERWLVWGLGMVTLIVGTIAVAAIYYLIQSG